MKEFRVITQIRNNLVLEACEAHGISFKEFCKKIDLNYTYASRLVRMEIPPVKRTQDWAKGVREICMALQADPNYLFPMTIRQNGFKGKELRLNAEELERFWR